MSGRRGEIVGKPGEVRLLLGNEAIARGVVEGGAHVACGYPGTPSSEVIDTLRAVAKEFGIYVEWSTNEKVAFEVAFAASMCGLRSIVTMKHVGLNVAADPFMSSGYTGAVGGFVILSADDPSMHSSQNEQDNRYYGMMAKIPVFEPYNAQEAKDMVKMLFEFSEKYETPVMLRTTTRLNHMRAPVRLGPAKKVERVGEFRRDMRRWVLIPANARVLRERQLERIAKVEEAANTIPFNKLEITKGAKLGIIASGVSYGHAIEALEILGIPRDEVSILKLGISYPIPKKLVKMLLDNVEHVLVVEEVEPVIEMQVKVFAKEIESPVKIHGKDVLPKCFELSPLKVAKAIAELLGVGKDKVAEIEKHSKTLSEKITGKVPRRPPVLCAGCPHRGSYYAMRRAAQELGVEPIFSGDIGCYTLGINKPFNAQDTSICMGASIGLGNGLSRFDKKRVTVAVIGDSTFYHTGVPPLINAVYNRNPVVVAILDNSVTAMTGHQPHPGTGYTAMGEEAPKIRPEKIAEGIGVEFVKVVDPWNLKESVEAFKEAIKFAQEKQRPAVVVFRRECALYMARLKRAKGEQIPRYRIDESKCRKCLVCVRAIGCPAIQVTVTESGEKRVFIMPDICLGCGMCAQVCPFGAISRER